MVHTSREVYEYISKQTGDPIVEWKTCVVSGTQFPIYQSDLDFYAKISPTFARTKFQIPTPALCPEERSRRRLMFRNERKLYRRTCDFSGKEIISIYSPDKPHKVYDQKIRLSDQWDPMSYGKDFDFSKTFMEQFAEQLLQVPRMSIQLINCENCDYSNIATSAKNCYLSSVNSWSEDVHYSSWVVHSKDTMDSYKCGNVEHCYNCYKCNHSSNLFCCSNCINSHHCHSSSQLDGCSYCFHCSNLVNKEYCINNEFVGKEKYLEQFPSLWMNSNSQIINHEGIQPCLHNLQSTECIGDNLTDCNNCVLCFDILKGSDCKYYADAGGKQYDCFDNSYGGDATLCFENVSCMGYGHMFSTFPWYGESVIYSDACQHCNHVFGCIGLRNKEYCIFNKQYTKQEYEELVGTIIRHMQSTGERGEFFSPSLSPFCYNETVAQDYFPLTQSEAIQKGYSWQMNNYDPKIPENVKVIRSQEFSQEQWMQLKGDDEIIKQIIICAESGRPFRILKQELDFYRKHDLPLPTFHPDIRHEHRKLLRAGRVLTLRSCDKCDSQMLSVYTEKAKNAESAKKVYCEECYKQEIYG